MHKETSMIAVVFAVLAWVLVSSVVISSFAALPAAFEVLEQRERAR